MEKTRIKISHMPSALSNKKGFTLFELMIVVLLIGIIYGIFVHKLSQKERRSAKDTVTLETLKTFLSSFSPKEEAVLRCFTPCKTCRVYRDGKQVDDLEISLFEEAPNAYTNDAFGQLRRIEFVPIEGKKKQIMDVCFEFTLFENGSSSNYIVEYDKKAYLFDPYLKPVKVYDSLDAASAAFDKSKLLPTQRRSYNH